MTCSLGVSALHCIIRKYYCWIRPGMAYWHVHCPCQTRLFTYANYGVSYFCCDCHLEASPPPPASSTSPSGHPGLSSSQTGWLLRQHRPQDAPCPDWWYGLSALSAELRWCGHHPPPVHQLWKHLLHHPDWVKMAVGYCSEDDTNITWCTLMYCTDVPFILKWYSS